MNEVKKIGIVGCGPRGLAALESLLLEIRNRTDFPEIKLFIFDDAEYLGAGTVWDPRQSNSNWINISLRGLEELKGREPFCFKNKRIPSFPKFTVWLENNNGTVTSSLKDKYPLRSTMGIYLNQRFQSLVTSLKDIDLIDVIKIAVDEINVKGDKILINDNNVMYELDECLLTVGHQTTVLDDQMETWKDHANKNAISVFTSPYQNNFLQSVNSQSTVGIRGLGLSTIDVARKLTLDLGGNFESQDDSPFLKFNRSSKCPENIVPFSLDGLVCAPKPLNMKIDRFFEPNSEEANEFKSHLEFNLKNNLTKVSSPFLIKTFAKSFVRKFSTNFGLEDNSLQTLVEDWLSDPTIKHPIILETDQSLKSYMILLCNMAMGIDKASLDYTIGQYWRWLQPIMYDVFSHCSLPDEKMAEIVDIDEKTKRYSYGPPVESILQLIALADDGILELSFCNNPEINLTTDGWVLASENNKISCDIMINSILSPPAVTSIASGPLKALIEKEDLELVNSDLGFSTEKDGQVICKRSQSPNISILGRNAKGSILGVDAILECFGPRMDDWAIGICNRLSE